MNTAWWGVRFELLFEQVINQYPDGQTGNIE
jgi:hypothetical protein